RPYSLSSIAAAGKARHAPRGGAAFAPASSRYVLLDCGLSKGGVSMTDRVIVQLTVRRLWMTVTLGLLVVVLVLLARPLWAQKAQESFRDKFNIAEEAGGVAIATSGDGKYVYVAGRNGVIVSDDFGKTGSWVQTVRMK